jgi:hypothetical protein
VLGVAVTTSPHKIRSRFGLYQFFVRKRSDKFAIIVFAEFTEPAWAGHRDTVEWSRRGRRQKSTTVLGTGLLLSTSHCSRILFPTPKAVTRFKQKERNRQQQDDREQYTFGKILSSVHSAQIVSPSIFNAVSASVSAISS